MTVSTIVNHEQYEGNGTTTVFPYRFRILKDSHMVVTVSDLDGNLSNLMLGTDYSITGVGLVSGGNVVLVKPLAEGWLISLGRDLPALQETDLRNQGRFYAETHEDAFDYLTMLAQKLLALFDLALSKPTWIAKFYDAKSNRISNLENPQSPQDAATKNYVDASSLGDRSYIDLQIAGEAQSRQEGDEQLAQKITEEADARASGDAYLQSQLTGKVPLAASAFSPISWHDQIIPVSVDIPPNVNAWSFGPQMTIAAGQRVLVGEDSFWTIADGLPPENPSNIDYGSL